MEAASCSLLYTPYPSTQSNSCYFTRFANDVNKATLRLSPSIFFPLSNNFHFFRKCLRPKGLTALRASRSSTFDSQNPSHKLAVLLEVDGVLMDAYRTGNRQAFNVAFQKLGLDCASWSEPVYSDLLRKSAGNEEKMLVFYFNRIGWPSSLPTNEKEVFVKSVLREKKQALDEFSTSKNSPLRPGVEEFIEEAWQEEVPVVILTSYSKGGEKISRSIIEKLGSEGTSKIKIVGDEEVNQSLYGQLVLGKRIPSGIDDQLAKEVSKAVSAEKQRLAHEVASILKCDVDIDTSSPESLEKVVAALRAGAEYCGLPVDKCILVAGSKSGVAGAERIGMPCFVLRSSLTSRAEFPSADAIMDGFGGADLTIAKLLQYQKSMP